jgi:fermentation-respiration switch protein FrsA (DUF1100 family)
MRTVFNIVLWGAVIYGSLLTFVYFTQSRLVFYPNLMGRALAATPANIGLAFEEVRATTADGIGLHGWFVPADGARNTVLFCHGNAGNISHRLDSIRVFHDLGLNVLIFDYRGYGLSDGKPSEAGTYLDAEAMWSHLTGERGIPPDEVILFGRSLGGAVAAELAAKTTPAAVIIESAFTSAPDLASRHFWYLPVRWLSRIQYPAGDHLSQVQVPTLVIHSPDDEIIPFEHGRALYDRVAGPKEFLEIRGGHNDGFFVSGPTYADGLRRFIAQHLPPG